MDLPRPDGAIFVVVFSTIITFFVSIAIYNLANFRIVPAFVTVLSAIWLLTVAAGIYSGITCENGVRNFIINRLATFSRYHFVEASKRMDGQLIVQFGFRLFSRRFVQLHIPASRIASVEWSPGQATSLAGRDMNDWDVAFWYYHKGSKRYTENGCREEALHIVGPSGPRRETAALGGALVAFLESAGIALYPSSNECVFTTREDQSVR